MDRRVNPLSNKAIGAALKVHSSLGPGLLESAYQACLCFELEKAGLKVRKEVPMPVVYEGIRLDHGYRIDILVEDILVIELKTVEAFTDVHIAQVLTYLRLGRFPLGLLFNFSEASLRKGIRRVILDPL